MRVADSQTCFAAAYVGQLSSIFPTEDRLTKVIKGFADFIVLHCRQIALLALGLFSIDGARFSLWRLRRNMVPGGRHDSLGDTDSADRGITEDSIAAFDDPLTAHLHFRPPS